MDIEECKEIAEMGWPENQQAQRQHDAVDWLIAEVERLNAMVVFDCREPGVCPEVQDLTDALQLMTEQRDGAVALLAAAQSRISEAEGEVKRLKTEDNGLRDLVRTLQGNCLLMLERATNAEGEVDRLKAEITTLKAGRIYAWEHGRASMRREAVKVAEGQAERSSQVFSIQGESWCLNVAAQIKATSTKEPK